MYGIFDMKSSDYDSVIDRTGFDPDRLNIDQADQHFSVLDSKQQIRARCSIWWRDPAPATMSNCIIRTSNWASCSMSMTEA